MYISKTRDISKSIQCVNLFYSFKIFTSMWTLKALTCMIDICVKFEKIWGFLDHIDIP